MHLALQRAIGEVERRGIEPEALREAEEVEVVAGEIDHGTNRLARRIGVGRRDGMAETAEFRAERHAARRRGTFDRSVQLGTRGSRASSNKAARRYAEAV